ncbi:MAG: C10 family peptidase, partial [Tannerella sp.]|nr:C10 family peptidase [Tannerella sp.]
MKKIRLLLIWTLSILTFLPAWAERVDIEKAEKVARSYARTSPQLTSRRDFRHTRTVSRRVHRNRPGLRSAQQQDEPMYHVFTMNGNGGFIIIAGDDAAKPVLGYSEEGTYDESNPALAYWMETLAEEIAGAIESDVEQDTQTKAEWDAFENENNISLRASGDYVDPLVKTKWNQGSPYNGQCPSGTVTGCVATAMAQIMKHHNHPTTGTGSHTNKNNTSLSANFGSTSYGWSAMTSTYPSNAAAATAVATLMYHCGISVDMKYGSTSGAYSQDVPGALTTCFGYDQGIRYHTRNTYPYTEWLAMLKTELRDNRPVYYSGYTRDEAGHAFVCDGYDTDDLFHINWGWGGTSDGFFRLAALDPYIQGIGGGSSGFSHNQAMITGIRPAAGGTAASIQMGVDAVSPGSASLASVTDPFNVSARRFSNTGSVQINTIFLGLMLCNQDGTYRSHKTSSRSLNLSPISYYPTLTLYTNYQLPAALPAGTYKLYPAYSTVSAPAQPEIISGDNGDKYVTVVVRSDGTVLLSSDSPMPSLTLKSLSTVGSLYKNKKGIFTAVIANSGATDYNADLVLKLGSQTVA